MARSAERNKGLPLWLPVSHRAATESRIETFSQSKSSKNGIQFCAESELSPVCSVERSFTTNLIYWTREVYDVAAIVERRSFFFFEILEITSQGFIAQRSEFWPLELEVLLLSKRRIVMEMASQAGGEDMRRLVVGCLLLIAGCSNRPLVGALDRFFPPRQPQGPQFFGGVGAPKPLQPQPPAPPPPPGDFNPIVPENAPPAVPARPDDPLFPDSPPPPGRGI